jgi:hypothetical protein
MKKFKILSAIAMAGLLGLSARASFPTDFSTVKIKLTVLIQTNDTFPGSSTKFNVTKLKVTNKEVLMQVANQFGALPSGAQLVLNSDGFFGGTFSVLNKDGTVFLANVSSSTNLYELNIENNNNDIFTGSENSSKETFDITTAADFFWHAGTGTDHLEIFGPATVKDTFGSNTDPESFKFIGAEDGELSSHAAIVTGSVSGHGKDTADF